jgi:hypothetical protein
MSFTGFFELKTPEDLFRKLEHDFQRIVKEPLDTFAAFDFFVTAEHMLDWVYPNDAVKQTAERHSTPLLEVCSHLANGSKHFQATNRRHRSVDDTRHHRGAFSNAFSSAFDISRLEIHLQGSAAATFGNLVAVEDLAHQVLDYWRAQLKL